MCGSETSAKLHHLRDATWDLLRLTLHTLSARTESGGLALEGRVASMTSTRVTLRMWFPLEDARRALWAILQGPLWAIERIIIRVANPIPSLPPSGDGPARAVDESHTIPIAPVASLFLPASSSTIPLPDLLRRQLPARTPRTIAETLSGVETSTRGRFPALRPPQVARPAHVVVAEHFALVLKATVQACKETETQAINLGAIVGYQTRRHKPAGVRLRVAPQGTRRGRGGRDEEQ